MITRPRSHPIAARSRGPGSPCRGAALIAAAALSVVADLGRVAADDDLVAAPTVANDARVDPNRDLAVRYARARLRLAELELERSLAINAQAPAAIGGREIERLEQRVASLRRRVEIARDQPRTAARQVTIAAAEAARDAARVDLDRAQAANRRMPGAVSEINLKRLEATVELADIRVQMCRSPDYELSLLAEMQWSLERLTEEVVDLRHRLDVNASQDFGR